MLFQYQPLHEGLPVAMIAPHLRLWISIPAPPRGASAVRVPIRLFHAISIPAPPRGASIRYMYILRRMISIPAPPRGASMHQVLAVGCIDFNTSPSTRGFLLLPDLRLDGIDFNTSPSTRGFGSGEIFPDGRKISIPAPPRGASKIVYQICGVLYFNTSPSTRGFPRKPNGALP